MTEQPPDDSIIARYERAGKDGFGTPSPAVVGDYTERARELLRALHCWRLLYHDARPIDDPDVGQIAAALSAAASEHQAEIEALKHDIERHLEHLSAAHLETAEALARLSAVASERDAAAIRAFGKRVWSDTEEVAYQAGVSDTRARLREPDAREALRSAFMGVPNWQVRGAPTNVEVAGDLADAALTKIAEMLK